MASYEIEIKSLLGDKSMADQLIKRLKSLDPNTVLTDSNQQLNHYFVGTDVERLYENAKGLFSEEEVIKFKHVVEEGSNFSVRTREVNGTVRLVLKASIDDTTSENGISRIEFDSEVSNMTLGELDQLILDSGFEYQAKWSRDRQEYVCKGTNVCIDRNAGYGYLAEFERIVDDKEQNDLVVSELRELMKLLEVEELAQDRLERMFSFYNENWPDYYGTDKIFIIE